jgi:hypothetical protein
MGPKTAKALREVGGVCLTKLGICGNQLAAQVERIHGVHFLDELGKTEATWVFEVQQFGPFFVAIDAHGNNYFERPHADTLSRIESIHRDLGTWRCRPGLVLALCQSRQDKSWLIRKLSCDNALAFAFAERPLLLR